MDLSDLLIVVAIGSGMYAILVSLTSQRQFLLKAVNPNRVAWALAGISVFWVGLSLMRWEAQSWEARVWLKVLNQLITDAPTPPRVKIAALALAFGLLLFLLVIWCVVAFPKDPTSFRQPKDRAAALKHYVRHNAGLDFALVALGDGEILAEKADVKKMGGRCAHLPKVALNGQAPRIRATEDQLESWRKLARRIHQEKKHLDDVLAVAHQGRNRRIVFDCDYGGIFFWYLRPPDLDNPVDQGIYLFAATLNQSEMSSGNAERMFQLLYEALANIEKSVRI